MQYARLSPEGSGYKMPSCVMPVLSCPQQQEKGERRRCGGKAVITPPKPTR